MRRRPLIALLAVTSGIAVGLLVGLEAFAGETTAPGSAPITAGDPAVTEVSALRDPQTSIADIPASIAPVVERLGNPPADAPAATRPGTLLAAAGHTLATGLGAAQLSMYALPTDKGGVCYALTNGLGSCVASFAHQPGRVAWFLNEPGRVGIDPVQIGGLVPDDVSQVQLIGSDGAKPLVVSRNAFFYEGDLAAGWPNGLLVKYEDGSSTTILLPGPPNP
jgi:hypothetical protein